MLRTLPGERVLLVDPAPQTEERQSVSLREGRRRGAASLPFARNGELVTAALLPVHPPAPAALQGTLTSLGNEGRPESNPLLRFAADPATGSRDAVAAAAMLLVSRGAVMFDAGDEIGLGAEQAPTPDPHDEGAPGTTPQSPSPVMQWTPANVQQAPIERPAAPVLTPGSVTQFGAYHPYVRPAPGSTKAKPPHADALAPAPQPDANTLPGFTSGTLPNQPVDGDHLNVTTEDRDPQSLLNAYRQLIALHADVAAVRNGVEVALPQPAPEAIVWLRRAPAGSHNLAPVLAAANFGDHPLTLSLNAALEAQGLRTGPLRGLFSSAVQPLTGETTGAFELPPHAVYVGEVNGSALVSAPPVRHGRRSRRRRR